MYDIQLITKTENGNTWIFDCNGMHKQDSMIYYDVLGNRAFQLHNGQRISALSYNAFGEDARNALIAYEDFLREGEEAWANIEQNKNVSIKFYYKPE